MIKKYIYEKKYKLKNYRFIECNYIQECYEYNGYYYLINSNYDGDENILLKINSEFEIINESVINIDWAIVLAINIEDDHNFIVSNVKGYHFDKLNYLFDYLHYDDNVINYIITTKNISEYDFSFEEYYYIVDRKLYKDELECDLDIPQKEMYYLKDVMYWHNYLILMLYCEDKWCYDFYFYHNNKLIKVIEECSYHIFEFYKDYITLKLQTSLDEVTILDKDLQYVDPNLLPIGYLDLINIDSYLNLCNDYIEQGELDKHVGIWQKKIFVDLNIPIINFIQTVF